MKFCDLIESKIYEDLKMLKFSYENFKNDPSPLVKVFDEKYKGQVGQSSYGEREDILGFNLNNIKNKEDAIIQIDKIDKDITPLANNKEEKFKRLISLYPEVKEFLRRYNSEYIKNKREV